MAVYALSTRERLSPHVTELSAIHRFSVPAVSLLGNAQRPSLFQSERPRDPSGKGAGGRGGSGGGAAGGSVHHKRTKKKKARGSVFGLFGGSHKPADLSKLFTNATLRAQATSESQRRELGLSEDVAGEGGEEPESRAASLASGVGATKNIMNQNMVKLNERGEKLDQLKDHTNKMMLSAMRFEEQVSWPVVLWCGAVFCVARGDLAGARTHALPVCVVFFFPQCKAIRQQQQEDDCVIS